MKNKIILTVIVVVVVICAVLYIRWDLGDDIANEEKAISVVSESPVAKPESVGAVDKESTPSIAAAVPSDPIVQEEASDVVVEPPEEMVLTEEGKISAAIAMVKDTSIELPKRKAAIEALGRKADEESIKTLMAIGDEHVYLNREAVKALGTSRSKEFGAMDYLKEKIADGDANIAVAAIGSLAMIMGRDAVAYIDPAFEMNYKRHDGHEEIICTSAIKTLAGLHAKSAIPLYVRELKRTEDKLWSIEYGSAVVLALAEVGGKAEAKLINEYADSLEADLPDDEMARASIQAKIDEAREAAKRM